MGRHALAPEASSTGGFGLPLWQATGTAATSVAAQRRSSWPSAPRVQVLDASVTHDDATVSLLLLATFLACDFEKEAGREGGGGGGEGKEGPVDVGWRRWLPCPQSASA